MKYHVTRPALLLNRPHPLVFSGTIVRNERGLFKDLEGVALPGAEVTLVAMEDRIAKVNSDVFGKGLYIDQSALEPGPGTAPVLPSRAAILDRMERLLGVPYVWGGNAYPGLPDMVEKWKPSGELSPEETVHWTAAGVDCSGLLYQAADGAVPRNTSELVSFGVRLPDDVAALQPLDMIVWRGHVVFVSRDRMAIESAFGMGGVVKRPLEARVAEILAEFRDKQGKDVQFRRFHPEALESRSPSSAK